MDFLRLLVEMETVAQKLAKDSLDFFQVTIGGKEHTIGPGESGLKVSSSVQCPAGSVRLEAFCGIVHVNLQLLVFFKF